MSRFSLTSVIALLLALVPVAAQGQHAQIQKVKGDAEQAVYEVTVQWPRSLAAAVDSTGASSFSKELVSVLTGGVWEVSESLTLPRLAAPRVRVLGTDYEELSLPARSDSAAFGEAVARVGGLGMERKKPAATLAFQLLHYDPETETLRRYRRVRVALIYGEATPQNVQRTAGKAFTNPHLAVEESALADGLIFKFAVAEEGIYRIDREALSSLLGDTDRSVDEVDPAQLKILGNGGEPLPALNSAPRPADLTENPVFVRGGADGSFDEGDELLFYARGLRGWRHNGNRWTHYVNPYSTANYYFLKVGTDEGLRLSTSPSYPGYGDAQTVEQVTGRHVVDFDEVNWTPTRHGSGRLWLSSFITLPSDRLSILEDVQLPGRVADTVQYRARVAIQSRPAVPVVFQAQDRRIGEAQTWSISNPGSKVARTATTSFTQEVSPGTSLNLSMSVDRRSNMSLGPKAALDWLRVFYPKRLQAEGGQVRWATPAGQTGPFTFRLRGFDQAPQVWDVTRVGAIQRLGVEPDGNTYRVQVNEDEAHSPRELIAFSNEAIRDLDVSGAQHVENQNLHGLQQNPDFVIVAPEALLEPAQQLAERRRQQGLRVLVAQRDKIRNEFSGGVPDMRAVRDFFKFLYDRGPDRLEPALQYALFMGDGHYDYREISDETVLENHLFPYETKTSLDRDRTFTSDDYFGLLDDDEGRWPYNGAGTRSNERLDLGIGRLPVQNAEEAHAVLDKIKRFESVKVDDAWRLRYTFVADDGPNGIGGNENDDDLHVKNIEVSANEVQNRAPVMNAEKIYGPSYDRVFLNGWRLPQANRDVKEAFQKGTLVLNYSGHGGPDALAQEQLFTAEEASELYHPDRPALVITATCSFGRWDMAREQSGAEKLLLNPEGGAAAMLTTVRVVYTRDSPSTLNAGLNREINRQLFKRDEEGRPRRIGDALRITKNTGVGREGNSRKFNLLGDPTMRIGLPRYQAQVNKINGQSVDEQSVALRALDHVQIEGQIQQMNGQPLSDFSGRAFVSVFDKRRRVNLPFEEPDLTHYEVREDLIWRGEASVQGGQFEATFRVPKDISYSGEPGRISLYATSGQTDAGGFSEDVVVEGTAENPVDDGTGPDIELFIDDSTFVSGGVTSADPTLIAKLHDQSGLNAVGAGVGHEMLLIVDGDKQNAVSLSDAFQTARDSYQRGRIEYPMERYPGTLESGPHQLKLTAWDVANNSGSAQLEFTITDAPQELQLERIYNVPNPTTGRTRFVIEHNQPPATPAEVQVRIYTLSGRPIRTIEEDDLASGGMLTAGPMQIPWNGRDADHDPLAPGIYLYKVRVAVEGPEGGQQVAERIEKLAIVR